MPDYYRWMVNAHADRPEQSQNRAAQAMNRITDKSTLVSFKRRGVTLTAQSIRIELDTGGRIAQSVFGGVAKQGIVLYGYKDHPDETDTDMEKGDRFVWNGQEYQIAATLETIGEIQGYGVVTT